MASKLFISHNPMPEDSYVKEIIKIFYVTNPKIPLLVFTPVVLALSLISLVVLKIAVWKFILTFLSAILFWSFLEYLTHRFLFHYKAKSIYGKRLVYSVHFGHHDYPNDNRLMLISPLITIPAIIFLYLIFFLILGKVLVNPFIAGLAMSYMFYDWLHFASHNYNYKNRFFQLLKKHHLKHHYKDPNKNYGFTSTSWDQILHTIDKT